MPQEPDYGYGFRYNSRDPKGLGFFGNFTIPGGVAGEYSIGTDLDGSGQIVEIPSLVPTLTRDEVQQVLHSAATGAPLPRVIEQKAANYARMRRAVGLPVFARTGEQRTDLYPDLPRAAVPEGRPQPPPMVASHDQPSSASSTGLIDLIDLVRTAQTDLARVKK